MPARAQLSRVVDRSAHLRVQIFGSPIPKLHETKAAVKHRRGVDIAHCAVHTHGERLAVGAAEGEIMAAGAGQCAVL